MPALSVNMQTFADISVHKRVTTTATATTKPFRPKQVGIG